MSWRAGGFCAMWLWTILKNGLFLWGKCKIRAKWGWTGTLSLRTGSILFWPMWKCMSDCMKILPNKNTGSSLCRWSSSISVVIWKSLCIEPLCHAFLTESTAQLCYVSFSPLQRPMISTKKGLIYVLCGLFRCLLKFSDRLMIV